MKRRITYIHGPDDPFDPKQLTVNKDSLHVDSLKGAREDRLTVGLYELPQEIWRALKQCHELYIRWVSPRSYASIAPFVSRASSGLHVFYTPQKDRSADLLCPILSKIFGAQINCTLPEDVFTNIPLLSERFASSTAFQYHEMLPTLSNLVVYIQEKMCSKQDGACYLAAFYLGFADYLDVDYDAISQSVTLTAFHHEPPHLAVGKTRDAWDERIDAKRSQMKIEVGILASEKATRAEELSLGGFLLTLGENTKPDPTLFSFPSRHHPSSGTFTTSFPPPYGLHPTLRLTFPSPLSPPQPSCTLHTYLVLPSALFPDKYQLSHANFLAANNLHSLRALSGYTDLEAPDWAVRKWGSAMLLELAPPTTLGEWSADIPLHLRYLSPKAQVPQTASEPGKAAVDIPVPPVFWACPADEGTKMSTNPFDRVKLGYESLFGPRTMFYHLQPRGPGVLEVKVPVMDVGQVGWVEGGTVVGVVVGFAWVVWVLWRGVVTGRGGSGREKRE